MKFNLHSYHLVDMSPWPLTGSLSALLLTGGLVNWFHFYSMDVLCLGIIGTLLTMVQWWRDVVRESTFQGLHTTKVVSGLKWGMILFIVSEVMFFFSFFWAFFHSSLSPCVELGMMWPPTGVDPFDPMLVPMLNTSVLLTSGCTVVWAHYSLIEDDRSDLIQSLGITIFLGFYFTVLQAFEYYEASFTIADSVYGCTFFVATGFHGLHVIIGTLFLSVCMLRVLKGHFSMEHHFGFEAAAWYWHFVDVVWLFLYISIYWWGS
uniref:Cytochrome c oxidase subunit 3 n=1 Tax=Eophreatoicus karrkkanj TaxID=496899 RepID=D3U707_9CRUS|nr:cytochrome c oxidase subunit III [Eophreatoicus sp. 14 FK-2009]ACN72765.1 cytochrome c oxidase subunit III [Eophreatoicus karrkkanj]